MEGIIKNRIIIIIQSLEFIFNNNQMVIFYKLNNIIIKILFIKENLLKYIKTLLNYLIIFSN